MVDCRIVDALLKPVARGHMRGRNRLRGVTPAWSGSTLINRSVVPTLEEKPVQGIGCLTAAGIA